MAHERRRTLVAGRRTLPDCRSGAVRALSAVRRSSAARSQARAYERCPVIWALLFGVDWGPRATVGRAVTPRLRRRGPSGARSSAQERTLVHPFSGAAA